MLKNRVAVVGAGISGLSAAYELEKSGFEVTVFEKNATVGGRMATRCKYLLPFDIGADFFIEHYQHTHHYVHELELDPKWQRLHEGKNHTFRKGQLYPIIFDNLWSILRFPLLSIGSRLRFLLFLCFVRLNQQNCYFFDLSTVPEHLDHTNAYDYVSRVAGREVADYVVDGFNSTYNFHSSKEVSFSAIFAFIRLLSVAPEKFWRCHTLGEMSTIPEALAKKVKVLRSSLVNQVVAYKNQVECRIEDNVEMFDWVVLASTADITKAIYQNPTDSQRELLENVKYASTINVSFQVPASLLKGIFCVTVPYVENKIIAEYINEAEKDIVEHGETLLNVGLHEESAQKMLSWSDEEIFSEVKQTLLKVCPPLNGKGEVLKPYDLQRWPKAMPKFYHRYVTQVKRFWEKNQGENHVYFCGDYLNAPWVEGSILCGKKVAQHLIERAKKEEETTWV